MNTNPDNEKLALWLEDELQGEELAAVEAWVAGNPEQLAARADVRLWRERIAAAVPASDEPPYHEFFNARIQRAIRTQVPEPEAVAKQRISWRPMVMPLAACAGMALTFWLGAQNRQSPPEVVVAGAPKAIIVEPMVYTPESGVEAERFASSDAEATVIVLNGVEAIPDETDFSKSVWLQREREIDSTAEVEPVESGKLGL